MSHDCETRILTKEQAAEAYKILETLRAYCKNRGGICHGCQLIDEDEYPHRHYCYLRNGLGDWIHAEYWAHVREERREE